MIAVRPEQSALVLLHLQNDFLHPDGILERSGADGVVLRSIVPAVRRLVDASERHGAIVTVVQLLPSQAELERRVVAADRSRTEKIADVDLLRRLQQRHDLTAPAPGTQLTVDNTDVDPAALADRLAGLVGFRPR